MTIKLSREVHRAPAGGCPCTPSSGVARVVAGNPENPGPPESISAGGPPRKLLQLYRASEGRVKGQNPLLWSAVQNPNMMHHPCSNHAYYHSKCTRNHAVSMCASQGELHNKRVREYSGGSVTEPLRLGDTRPKRKKLDARKRPSFVLADPCRKDFIREDR